MKNYKTEINKIRDLYYFGDITGEQLTDSMINIIREIVQEARINSDNWTHTHDVHIKNESCRACIRDDSFSEILSNVEEMIK